MVSKIADTRRSVSSDGLLPLQTPSLVLGQVHFFFRSCQTRWSKVLNSGLYLRQCVTCIETFDEGGVGLVRSLEQAVSFVRSEISRERVKHIVIGSVDVKAFGYRNSQRIVKDS